MRKDNTEQWTALRAQAQVGFNLADAIWNYLKHDTRTVHGGRCNIIIFTKR